MSQNKDLCCSACSRQATMLCGACGIMLCDREKECPECESTEIFSTDMERDAQETNFRAFFGKGNYYGSIKKKKKNVNGRAVH